MFCEACGTRLEQGSVLCPSCGTSVRERPRETAEKLRTAPEPELALPGPKCATHLGMPLAGLCPRCGKPVCIRCAPEAARDILTCTDCYGLTAAHQKAPGDAVCATHPASRATFICSRCGSFSCTACTALGFGSEGLCVRCAPSAGQLATRGARFAANLVDNFLVVLPIAAGFILAAVSVAHDATTGGKGGDGSLGTAELWFILAAFFGLLLGCGVQIAAQVQWGQSVGKRMLGIKVVRLNGQAIELWRLLLLRNIVVHVVAQACGVIGLVDALMIFGQNQRCLHDYLADTVVVQVGPPQ